MKIMFDFDTMMFDFAAIVLNSDVIDISNMYAK